jgi:predicted glycogen debranching enzyme
MIRFDASVCADFTQSRKLEWLETNGLGGFSSSTITGLNTRRYHGLLTAATRPPVGRMVLLSKMEETLLADGRHFDLSANQYPGAIYPQGQRYLKEFRLDPFPTFVYSFEGIEAEKRVFMVHGENTTVIEYRLRIPASAPRCVLELRPLIAFRDYHSTTHHNDAIERSVHSDAGIASVTPYQGLPTLYFAHNAAEVESTGNWYFNFEYAAELERGLDAYEDLFNPLVLRFPLNDGFTATVIASTVQHAAGEAPSLATSEMQRRKRVIAGAPSADALVQQLTAASDQFIVQRNQLSSVIAGYHWFADWGRDTMVALPGLTLMTGRPNVAKSILETFAQCADRGMLPNRFPDTGEPPEYNTVDAALWLFEAVRSYLQYTGDRDFVRERIYPQLHDIVNWHVRGTRYGIHVDRDGLLACGEPGVQLTWMDAKASDLAVTPRIGKPVEIQALWYNALCVLRELAREFGDSGAEAALRDRAQQARESFGARFWNAQAGGLYDVVNGEERDASIRPNQILAVSLRHTMLPADRERQIVDLVQRELLTPMGLRSLAPGDQNYKPHYEGGVRERDAAYHQGTVWPWLMGPFISAYVKVHGRSAEAKAQAEAWFRAFDGQLRTAGLGQVSEIADAEPPFTPRGCIAQAWSVAELLRSAVEDIFELPLAQRAGTATR